MYYCIFIVRKENLPSPLYSIFFFTSLQTKLWSALSLALYVNGLFFFFFFVFIAQTERETEFSNKPSNNSQFRIHTLPLRHLLHPLYQSRPHPLRHSADLGLRFWILIRPPLQRRRSSISPRWLRPVRPLRFGWFSVRAQDRLLQRRRSSSRPNPSRWKLRGGQILLLQCL